LTPLAVYLAHFIPLQAILCRCGAFIGATGDNLLLAEVRAIDFYLFYSIFIYFRRRAHKTRALGATLETLESCGVVFPWLVRGRRHKGAQRAVFCSVRLFGGCGLS